MRKGIELQLPVCSQCAASSAQTSGLLDRIMCRGDDCVKFPSKEELAMKREKLFQQLLTNYRSKKPDYNLLHKFEASVLREDNEHTRGVFNAHKWQIKDGHGDWVTIYGFRALLEQYAAQRGTLGDGMTIRVAMDWNINIKNELDKYIMKHPR